MTSIFILYRLTALTLVLSCTEIIDINLDSMEPELIVEGAISNDTTSHLIILRKTADYFTDQDAERISGAEVILSDGYSTVPLTESKKKAGYYLTPATYAGVVNRTYTLTIKNVDINNDGLKETYTASCRLNPVAKPDSFTFEKKKIYNQEAYSIQVYLQDPPEEKNYYLIRLWKNNVSIMPISKWIITDDDFFNPEYLTNNLRFNFFPTFIPRDCITDSDRVKIEVCGITKEYMNFVKEAIDAYRSNNPVFGSQPANISTNIRRIEPGKDTCYARGFFAAYAVGSKEMVYREKK